MYRLVHVCLRHNIVTRAEPKWLCLIVKDKHELSYLAYSFPLHQLGVTHSITQIVLLVFSSSEICNIDPGKQ